MIKKIRPLFFNLHLLRKVLVLIAIAGFFYSCKKNEETSGDVDCSGPQKSFSADVSPIVQASCATNGSCHAAGSSNGPGALINYSEIFNARSEIRPAVASGHMPMNGSLTAAEKAAIICWIDNGALDN